MVDEQKTERVQLMMTPSEVKAIDDWSFENRVRGRSEAIRKLVDFGLQALGTQHALSSILETDVKGNAKLQTKVER